MANRERTLEEEISGIVAAGDWPRLLRMSIVVPNSLDIDSLAWKVIRRAHFPREGQLSWLRRYVDASEFSIPIPGFVNCWSDEELATLQLLPLLFMARQALNTDLDKSFNPEQLEAIASVAHALTENAEVLQDSFLMYFAELAKASVAAAVGSFADCLNGFLKVNAELCEHEREWPVLTQRLRPALSELGRPIARSACDYAVRAGASGDPVGFETATALFPLALTGWTAFSLADHDEHELEWTRIALNYANFLSERRDSDECLSFYNQVVSKRRDFVHERNLPWRYELGTALRNFAAALSNCMRFQDSIAHASEGVELIMGAYSASPPKYSDLLAGLLTNRCHSQLATGHAKAAMADAKWAVKIRRKDFGHRLKHGEKKLVLSLSVKIHCASALGKFKLVDRLLDKARGLLESDSVITPFDKNQLLISLYLELAQRCEENDRRERALTHSLSALSCSKAMVKAGKPETDRLVIAVIAAVGRRALEASNGDDDARLDLADRMFRKVLLLIESTRAKSDNKLMVQAVEYSYSDVADSLIEICCRRSKNVEIAEDVIAFSEAARMRSLGDKIDLQFDELAELIPGDLLSELRAVQSDLDRVNDELYCSGGRSEEVLGGHTHDEDVSFAVRQILSAGMEMHQIHKDRFERQLVELFERVNEIVPDFDPAAPEALTIAETRALLPDDTSAFVHFHIADRISLATIVTARSAEVIQLPGGERGRLKSLASEWVAAYSSARDQVGNLVHGRWRISVGSILAELGRLIVQPVLEQIDHHIDRLIIIPHRELHVFPLHICGGREADYLADEYVVEYSPSIRVMKRCHRRKRPAPSHVFATRVSTAANLPFAEMEIRAIRSRFGPKSTLLGVENQTREELFAAATEVDIFHHAGHGRHHSDDPLDSTLEFGARNDEDNVLSVRDLLETIRFPKGTLAVLATCEGGIVQADAVDEHFGFPTACLVAGMKASVTALWNAGDLETFLLMHRFYHFLSIGSSASQSLTNAQAWMRGQRDCEGEGLSDGDSVRAYIEKHSLISENQSPEVKKFYDRKLEEWEEMAKAPFESPTTWGGFILTGVDC